MAEGAQMDLPAHERTYTRFIGVAKTSTAIVAIIALVVVLIIAR